MTFEEAKNWAEKAVMSPDERNRTPSRRALYLFLNALNSAAHYIPSLEEKIRELQTILQLANDKIERLENKIKRLESLQEEDHELHF